MPYYEKTASFSNAGTRNEVRIRVLKEFLKEKPGTGKGDAATHYTYYVEKLLDGKRIFLTRPGFLNKQFDFVINVEGINFNKAKSGRRRTNPTHDDICSDLQGKKKNDPKNYKKLYYLMQRIYNCKEITSDEYENLEFDIGYPVDLVLLVTKWYFIEQDIAYWNYSGRAMFMSGIPEP